MGKRQGKIKIYLLLFLRIFWITFITACQPRLTCSEKNTSNHCFAFINTLQSCLLLFDKTVNHLWRQFTKHWEHLDFWRRLEGIGAEVHTFISSNCVSPKNSDFYPFYKKKVKFVRAPCLPPPPSPTDIPMNLQSVGGVCVNSMSFHDSYCYYEH